MTRNSVDSIATTGASTLAPGSPLAPTGWRYVLGNEIGHGGMGVVYRATDAAFGREVAVKVLHEKFGPDSGAARRFADEARITGQLQHPAIPPVHDLGTLPDGRPFLAMKLIRGRTLDHLLSERPDLGHDRGRFVAAFEQVCQAVAYAHSHNVIHRDLKPANVMVGNYGEVQVMDWGLAKVLAVGQMTTEADPEQTTAPTVVQSLRDSDGSFTQAGAVLGTPAFMPPEQAVGAIGKVDVRSDVFGLGAVLAVILTGKPPFAASSAETVRVKAAQGDVAECFARLDACGAEPELVALCKRCLSPKPADRPGDAGEVARTVAALRAAADERARQAELDRVKAEGEKVAVELQAAEQKKRQRVQLVLALAIGLIVCGGAAVGWWQNEQTRTVRERLDRNVLAVGVLLEQCETALRDGDADKATVALEAAQKRSDEGGADELAERLAGLGDDLALLRDLDAIDRFRWTAVDNKYPDAVAVAARYREALGRFGVDPDAVPADEVAARVSASAVRDRLVMALDRLSWEQKTVRTVLGLVDANPYRDAVRDAILAKNPAKIVELAEQPAALVQPPGFAAFLGEQQAIGVERRRQLLEAAVSRRPGDLGLLMTLGNTYPINQENGANERLRWFQAAVAVAPTNSSAYSNLGAVLLDKKELAGAEDAFRQAIRLDTNLTAAHNNLGNVLWAKKDLAGAEAAYREAIRLDPKPAPPHNNLGNVLWAKKDLAGAEAAYREAIRLDPKLANVYTGLGNVLSDKKDLAGAEAAFRQAIRLDPKLANAHNNLGNVLRDKKDLPGAEAAFRQAIRLDPKLAAAHTGLGAVLSDKKDLAGAEAAYRQAIRLDPKLANAHNNLGNVLRDKKDLAGAEAAYRQSIRLDPQFVLAHLYLGWTLQQKGELDSAIAAFEQVLRIDPKHSWVLVNLPRAKRMRELLRRLPDIVAGKTWPKDPAEACEFARLCSLPFQKRYAASARLYEKAFAADPKLAETLVSTQTDRYNAACYAVRAAGGEGIDAPTDAAKRTALRNKALAWLRADLALWKKQAVSANIVERNTAAAKLAHWLADSDLSGVREAKPLKALPADERETWQKFWEDVKATHAQAQKQPPSVERLPPPQVEK